MPGAFPRRRVAPRPGPYARLLDHFHTHPYGRLQEFLFWTAVGLVLGGLAYWGWATGHLSTPLALLIGVVALCFVGFAMLPQRKRAAPPPPPKGKRGQIAQQVKASKAEKRKGPGPPIQ